MTDNAVHMVPVYEKDLKAVWQLLTERNPVGGGKAATLKAAPQAEAQVTSAAQEKDMTAQDEEVFPQWANQTLEEYYTMCKPVQRAILDRVAEAGVNGTSVDVEEDV